MSSPTSWTRGIQNYIPLLYLQSTLLKTTGSFSFEIYFSFCNIVHHKCNSFGQHCGYWWPGDLAPDHQRPQGWISIHAFPAVYRLMWYCDVSQTLIMTSPWPIYIGRFRGPENWSLAFSHCRRVDYHVFVIRSPPDRPMACEKACFLKTKQPDYTVVVLISRVSASFIQRRLTTLY